MKLFTRRAVHFLYGLLGGVLLLSFVPAEFAEATHAATDNGEIEDRPSPTFRRICLAGPNAGQNCSSNAACPSSTCFDRNVYNITVAILYDAPAGDLTAIQNLITQGSATLFDVTDGQAEIGHATIHNNAVSTANADFVVHPATNPVWWQALSGHFRIGGFMEVSINNIIAAGANGGGPFAHEFSHLVFDVRDEYETRLAGCGAATQNGSCPVAAANNGTCLMDGNGTEFCWGQGNPANATDLTNGNHDPTNVTEQSVCRANRSCWAQVNWSWPATFQVPAGAPDANANGATVGATTFTVVDDDVRVVLVLDESGSMDLESPKRIERLKVAAGDFVATAENGTEIGIVSFASDAETASGRVSVAIAALGANRSAWTNEIDGLAPATRTNIGAGLQKAKDMIVTAGGVTANTYIVLMTDGVNNEPGGGGAAAQADLDAKVADLLASGIPVFVTCTGGDLGLQSQCAEIASGTNGTFSDSADAARLPQNFVDFHERITGHQGVGTVDGKLKTIGAGHGIKFLVDQFSDSASFSLLWDNKASSASVVMIDPSGTRHQTRAIPQGRYARIKNPLAGEWTMIVDPGGADSRAIARAYVQNRVSSFVTSTRHPSQEPGEEIYVYASARSLGGGLSEPGTKLVANVTLPNGGTATLDLFDNGRDPAGHGDDMAGDGIYTGVFTNTSQKGAYGFSVTGAIDKWHQGSDPHNHDSNITSPRFNRDVRVSAAVGSPGDVVTNPEDDRPKGGTVDVNRWILILILILIIILIIMQWLCCRKRSPDQVIIR
jgi:hypothetical protein